MNRIGFTGTLIGVARTTLSNITLILASRNPELAVHGCAIGADEQFHRIARTLGIPVVGHPSTVEWKRMEIDEAEFSYVHPADEPLARNKSIVRMSEFMICCPKNTEEELRSGTWATMREARRKGVPGVVLVGDLVIPLGLIWRDE